MLVCVCVCVSVDEKVLRQVGKEEVIYDFVTGNVWNVSIVRAYMWTNDYAYAVDDGVRSRKRWRESERERAIERKIVCGSMCWHLCME